MSETEASLLVQDTFIVVDDDVPDTWLSAATSQEVVGSATSNPQNDIDTGTVDNAIKLRRKWTEKMELEFLDIYEGKQSSFSNGKKSHNAIWKDICKKLSELDNFKSFEVKPKQAKDKFRTLRGRYTDLKRQLGVSGSPERLEQVRREFPAFDKLDAMVGDSPLIEPELVISSKDPGGTPTGAKRSALKESGTRSKKIGKLQLPEMLLKDDVKEFMNSTTSSSERMLKVLEDQGKQITEQGRQMTDFMGIIARSLERRSHAVADSYPVSPRVIQSPTPFSPSFASALPPYQSSGQYGFPFPSASSPQSFGTPQYYERDQDSRSRSPTFS